MLITTTQVIFWDCRVHFKFLSSFDNLSHNNCIRLTGYLQLHINENLHSHLILRFFKSVQMGEEE